MIPQFFKSGSFWNRCEYTCTALSAGFSAFTATQTQDHKRIPASFAFACACLVAYTKWQSNKITENKKNDKENQDRLNRDRHEQELENIRRDSRIEDERRNRELAEIKTRHTDAVKKMMDAILEDFHRKYFRKEAQDEKHKHRVTVFYCIEIDGDAGKEKRLKIFARAGVHKDSDCSWPVDDNDPVKCRGIAAQIWFHGVGSVRTAGLRLACEWRRRREGALC